MVSLLKRSSSRLTLDKRLDRALSASIRCRTASRRTVSMVESRLGQLRPGSGSESSPYRAEERRRFGPERVFPGVRLVQSLNSPFFPPHIRAEPGRAKEESRITCMRMLRTNQSKITRSQPRRSRQCVSQCLFQLALCKKT